MAVESTWPGMFQAETDSGRVVNTDRIMPTTAERFIDL
jgi:hypothetical protein